MMLYMHMFFVRSEMRGVGNMVYRKSKMHSLFTLPLAGLLFLLCGAQAAHAEQIDSLLPERSQQEIVQKWNQ